MERKERKVILDNLENLVFYTKNVDSLIKKLMERRLLNEFMKNEILSKSGKEKVIYLYKYITTRGPHAFLMLKNALISLDYLEAAALLKGCSSSARQFRPLSYKDDLVEIDSDREEEIDSDREEERDNEPAEERENGETEGRENGETEEQREEAELTVIKSQQRMDSNLEKAYKMGSRPKGHALILNVREFVNNIEKEREGSEHDVRSLTVVLNQLGYTTHAHPNEKLTRNELLGEVRKFCKKDDHYHCDSSIVVIMSHGSTDHSTRQALVKTHLGENVFLQDITDMFSADQCTGLANKPKIFFFQSCRGDMPHSKVKLGNGTSDAALQTDGWTASPTTLVRQHADILIGYATIEGYVAYRDSNSGSWFIQELCRALARLAHKEDLCSILEEVDRKMSRSEVRGHLCQTPESNHSFSKKVYFNPGLYDNDSDCDKYNPL